MQHSTPSHTLTHTRGTHMHIPSYLPSLPIHGMDDNAQRTPLYSRTHTYTHRNIYLPDNIHLQHARTQRARRLAYYCTEKGESETKRACTTLHNTLTHTRRYSPHTTTSIYTGTRARARALFCAHTHTNRKQRQTFGRWMLRSFPFYGNCVAPLSTKMEGHG